MKKSTRDVIVNLLRASSAIALCAFFAACGSESGSNPAEDDLKDQGKSSSSITDDNSVEAFEDLPKCTQKKAGVIYDVLDDEEEYICFEDELVWVKVVSKLPPECDANEDEFLYVKKDFYTCVDEEWVEYGKSDDKISDDEEDGSSSSKDDGSNDDDDGDLIKIGETVIMRDTLVLHQTVVVRDTTYVTVVVTKEDEEGNVVAENQLIPMVNAREAGTLSCNNAMFCGKRGDYRVNTGFSDASDTYGYWYTYTDEYNDGNSKFTWPYGIDDYGSFVNPSVLATAGIQGSVKMGSAYEYPYAGLGFNLKNEDQTSGVNINAWDGMCVVYYANKPMYLEIHPANEGTVTENNNPKAVLPSSLENGNKNLIADIDWEYFVQEAGWGKEVSLSSVLKNAKSISFKFTDEPGSTYDFIIFAIGKKGTCSTTSVTPPPSSSSSSSEEQTTVDVLNGAGDFVGGTGSLTNFDYGYWDELDNQVGVIETIYNDDDERVLQFYPTADCDENWYMQLRKNVTLTAGYSYQIVLEGYDYGTHLEVPVGLQMNTDPYTMVTEEPYVWDTGDSYTWESTPLDYCGANKTVRLFVNGGFGEEQGFALKYIKLLTTPLPAGYCD